MEEALLPDLHERLPSGAVGGFEGGEVGLAFRLGFGGEHDAGQVEAAEKLEEEKADGAAVEILEGVDAEKATFGEGEKLQREIARCIGGRGPAGLKIGTVVAHLEREEVRGGRSEAADADFDGAPPAGLGGHEIVADEAVKLREEIFVERGGGIRGRVESLFGTQHALGQQRCYLAVGEDSASGLKIAGGVVRACSS